MDFHTHDACTRQSMLSPISQQWSQCFSCRGSNGEISVIRFEPMHVAAKLTLFLGLPIKINIFCLYQFSLYHTIWEKKVERMIRCTVGSCICRNKEDIMKPHHQNFWELLLLANCLQKSSVGMTNLTKNSILWDITPCSLTVHRNVVLPSSMLKSKPRK
jgi:hypothetical protein